LTESFEGFSGKHAETLIGAVSAGFFFILLGAIFVVTPKLFNEILDFFRNFDIVSVPNLENLRLPAPTYPRAHLVVYQAVEQFSYVWGLFQIVILALRLFAGSPWNKKAETMSNLVFWFGTGYLTRTFLIETTRWASITGVTRWFVFWAGIITLIGVSLVIRAIILAVVSARHVI